MHPDLQFFLESAFDPIQPTSARIGRVVVEPDYDVAPQDDGEAAAKELVECLRELSPGDHALASHEGFQVGPPRKYATLSKYIRTITLHGGGVEGPWIEVAPPGNWI